MKEKNFKDNPMTKIRTDNIKNSTMFSKNSEMGIEGDWYYLEFIKCKRERNVAKCRQKSMSEEV